MSQHISRDEVAHVARLARLRLTDGELDLYTTQLEAVLTHVSDVEMLDVDGVEPTAHPFPLVNVTRPDVLASTLDREEVLAAAPEVEDGLFKVPQILGEEP